MKILYITRKFPPSTGGMQTQSSQFYRSISKRCEVVLISWGHSQAFLSLFALFAFFKAIIRLKDERIDIVQLGDLALSPLGFLIKLMYKKPVLAVSHGRDSAYSNLLYNLIVIASARRLDRIICVSNNIKERLAARGLPVKKLKVIPNGIDMDDFKRLNAEKRDLISRIGACYNIDLENKKIILSVSRLVAKKGIKEFIEDIFIKIREEMEEIVFLVVGDGPEKKNITRTIRRLRLSGEAYLLGSVKHNSYIHRALFKIADIFVMPNVRRADDAEGFGVVALEAGLMGVPVVAFDVDGIGEAIHDKQNGILVEEGDKDGFVRSLLSLMKNDNLRREYIDKAEVYIDENFNWDRIADLYTGEYSRILNREDKEWGILDEIIL